MPSAITAVFTADARPYARELRAMEAMSIRAGVNIQSGISGTTAGYSRGRGSLEGHGGHGGVIGEAVVLARELGRGNYARVPGSLSILIQRMGFLKFLVKDNVQAAEELTMAMEKEAQRAANLAKWTTQTAVATRAAYEAEGTNVVVTLAQVDADERAAVAARVNAEAMREKAAAAKEAEAGAGVSISTLGLVAIALVAVGAAAYFTWRHFKNLAIEEKNAADLTDITTHSFEEQAKALRAASEAHQAEIDRLNALAVSEKGLKDSIEETLKVMRERAKFEHELAAARGATKGQLAQLEISAAETELTFLKASTDQLKKKVDLDKAAEISASNRLEEFKGGNGPVSEATLNQANSRSELAAKLVDAIKTEMVGRNVTEAFGPVELGPGGVPFQSKRVRPAAESDVLDVTVDGKKYSMSLNEALAAHKKDSDEAARLAAIQKELSDAFSDKKKLTDRDVERLNSLKSEANDLESALGLKKEFLPILAGLGGGNKLQVTEREKIGAASNSISISLLDVGKKSLEVQSRLYELIRQRHGEGGVGGAFFD